MVNPGVKYPTNAKQIPLTMNKNKPREKIVAGKVKNIKIGRTMALMTPKTIAPIKAAVIVLIAIPGIMKEEIINEIAVMISVTKNLGILEITIIFSVPIIGFSSFSSLFKNLNIF